MKLALQYLNSGLIVIVALRQTAQLMRHRDDLALRALAAGLIALATAATINIDASPIKPVAEGLIGPIFGTIVNSLWMTMAYCFAAFFLLADRSIAQRVRVRIAQRELLILLGAILTCVLISRLFRQELFPTPDTRDYRTVPRVVYDLTFNGTGILFVVIGLSRAARYLRVITHTWLKWSVRLVCIGAVGKAGVGLLSLIRLLLRILEDVDYPKRYPVVSFLYLVCLLGGQTILVIGLILPRLAAGGAAVTGYRARRTQARRSRQMEPLWRALTQAVPFVVLPGQPEGHGHDDPVPGTTYHRRITEITDALAQLAPYYAQVGLDSGQVSTGVRDPHTAARIIEAAVREHNAGNGRAEPPFPRIEPDHASWREHSEWMVATSRAFEQISARTTSAASR